MTHINYNVHYEKNSQKKLMDLIYQKIQDDVKVKYSIKTSNGSITSLRVDTKDKEIKNLIKNMGFEEQ